MQSSTEIKQKRGGTADFVHRQRRIKSDRHRGAVPANLVRLLITEHLNPAQLLELYYWSREPELTDVMRSFIALPKETRETLQAFLAAASDPRSVSVAMRRSDRITLSLPQART